MFLCLHQSFLGASLLACFFVFVFFFSFFLVCMLACLLVVYLLTCLLLGYLLVWFLVYFIPRLFGLLSVCSFVCFPAYYASWLTARPTDPPTHRPTDWLTCLPNQLNSLITLYRFKQNVEINVLQNSKLNIVCPNPASVLDKQDSSIPQEQMYENMWIVDKHEYDTCSLNTSAPDFSTDKRILGCNSPLQLKYYPLVFRAFSAPGGLEFKPGTKYYFIGKFTPSPGGYSL